eukprot:gene8576-7826_t
MLHAALDDIPSGMQMAASVAAGLLNRHEGRPAAMAWYRQPADEGWFNITNATDAAVASTAYTRMPAAQLLSAAV